MLQIEKKSAQTAATVLDTKREELLKAHSQNTTNKVTCQLWTDADFSYRCQGDGMAPTIQNGNIVGIRRQSTAESGDIVAVRVGDELIDVYKRQGYGYRGLHAESG